MATAQLECPLSIDWETLPPSRQPRVITEYSLDSAFTTSTDEWSVSVYDDDPERLRWLKLQPLQLSIHGKPQLLGRVERVSRGHNGREVTISGRDHLSAIVEGNIDPTVRVTEDMTLAQAIVLAAGPYGIDTVFGESDAQTRNLKSGASLKAGKDQGFAALDPGNLKPEAGMGVYEWLNRLAARQGCTIQPGPTRNSVILLAPNYESAPIVTLFRSNDPTRALRNNILEATAEEDLSTFPTCGLATGKVAKTGEAAKAAGKEYDIGKVLQSVAPKLWEKIADLVWTKRYLPTAGTQAAEKLYRLLYVKDEQSRKPEQVERGITRAVADRLRATLSYQAKVKGHIDHDSGFVFAVDTMATVLDDVCDLDEALWVHRRRFSYRRGAGAVTELDLWRPGSFVL